MYSPKSEVYKALKTLGCHCVQGSQASFNDGEIPAITFRIGSQSTNLDHDLEIADEVIEMVVDIWADDSVTTTRILNEVEATMRKLHYRLSYSADIPAPTGALFHTSARFTTVR